MHFASLSALGLLPFIGGLIVLMYVLKLRRKDVVVSSTYLWRQVIRDVQANAPFQKLRKNLLLFLQLLIAALLIFALARPFTLTQSPGGRTIVLIVDTSASMRATDILPSRLDAARQEAQQIVRRMGAGDTMLILSASSRPEAVSGFTGEKAELLRVIDSLQPHDTPTNMRDALTLAADLVASRNNGESGLIELVSDGGFEAENGGMGTLPQVTLANLNLGKAHVTFHPIGKGHDNVGITAVDFRRNLGGDRSVQLLVVTHNYSAQAKKVIQEISIADNLFDAHEISLPANGESTEAYDVQEPDKPVTLKVRLDVQDDLAVDNEATLVLRPRKILKVLLVGTQNLWLENALKVDPGVLLSRATAFSATQASAYDVILFNETAPAKLPEGNYLFLHCTSDQCPAKVSGETNNVGFADIERTHPVLRYVDFGSENLLGVYKASPQSWGKEIAVGDSGSLIVTGEKNKMRAEFVSFSLDKSIHFLLTVAFPIFLSNSVRWLGTGSDDSEQSQIHTGDTLTIPAPPGSGKLTVIRPDGTRSEIVAAERGGAVFSETNRIGLYRVEGGNSGSKTFSYLFAANLTSAPESDITPHRSLAILQNPLQASLRKVPTQRQLLPSLAGIALLLLLIEWYVFHRRVHLNG